MTVVRQWPRGGRGKGPRTKKQRLRAAARRAEQERLYLLDGGRDIDGFLTEKKSAPDVRQGPTTNDAA